MSARFEDFADRVREAFGNPADPIHLVAQRAEARFGEEPVIVWEGDAQTFQFSFVSASAEDVLGHPCARWTDEPTFWADHVIHPDDRDDAVAYCALATGKGKDHAFEYRARASDGRTVHLVDYVQVIFGARGIPERLRGIMIDVSDAPSRAEAEAGSRWESPPRLALDGLR